MPVVADSCCTTRLVITLQHSVDAVGTLNAAAHELIDQSIQRSFGKSHKFPFGLLAVCEIMYCQKKKKIS
jgi:hypothetical protein